jgi:hypothetical protein
MARSCRQPLPLRSLRFHSWVSRSLNRFGEADGVHSLNRGRPFPITTVFRLNPNPVTAGAPSRITTPVVPTLDAIRWRNDNSQYR